MQRGPYIVLAILSFCQSFALSVLYPVHYLSRTEQAVECYLRIMELAKLEVLRLKVRFSTLQ